MRNRWSNEDSARYDGDLAQRVYTSRLLGAESKLVLHGGGNTSVKGKITDIFGDSEDVLFVKGSGWDLETIEAAGFSPCRMSHLLRLAALPALSDAQMAVELKKSLTDVGAPAPSVEAILHALLPARFVDHTHADAVLSITNSPDGEARVREIYGDRLVIVPYVMPGFKLARLCALLYPRHAGPQTIGMLLMNHGLFTFGESARTAYERMIALVSEAEDYLARHVTSNPDSTANDKSADSKRIAESGNVQRSNIAALRRAVADAAGVPLLMKVRTDMHTLEFGRRANLAELTQQGPATPDHVIRTKRVPLLGQDVGAYAAAYREYFAKYGDASLRMLDPAPRVILDPTFGLCSIGRTAKDASIVEDIYLHTMDVILQASALGGWHALPPHDIFEVEYWDLEQQKLRRAGPPALFAGEAALVTGAASGIGKACVASLLARGAAVVGLDIDPAVKELHRRPDYLGIPGDLTSETQISRALDRAVDAFGGLDMLILNAGIFPTSHPIAELHSDVWRKTLSINLDANLVLLRDAYACLKLAPRGGRVVLIGSKNVAAPGPGAAAYSASKAALQQLARVAALEWGRDRIRVNTLHPNAVFDTALWTPAVLAARAASYGMSVEEYKANNVLKVEVSSRDVAELAAELCGPLFAKTTGAQIPVDGGLQRVI